MRAKYELKAEEQKTRRLEIEHRQAVVDRERVVSKVYLDYQKTLTPKDTILLPPEYDIFQFPPFSRLINAPGSSGLDESSCANVVEQLPALTKAWSEDHLAELASVLPEDDRASASLITSVYMCGSRLPCICRDLYRAGQVTPLFGTGEAMLHGCCGWCWADSGGRRKRFHKTTVAFSSHGKGAVENLLTHLGRDAKYTRPADLDAMDIRVCCLVCRKPEAFPWRAYVCHSLSSLLLQFNVILLIGYALHGCETHNSCMRSPNS